jgi:hypothetical protein
MGDPEPSLERRVDNAATKQRNLSGHVFHALRKSRIEPQELDSPSRQARSETTRANSKHRKKFRTL